MYMHRFTRFVRYRDKMLVICKYCCMLDCSQTIASGLTAQCCN